MGNSPTTAIDMKQQHTGKFANLHIKSDIPTMILKNIKRNKNKLPNHL